MSTPNRGQRGSPATREALSARSRGILLQLSQLPTLVIPGVMLVLMLVGLSAPLPFALPAFAVIAVFVAWLAYLSWPILDSRARLLRGVMLAVVIGAAVARLLGWL